MIHPSQPRVAEVDRLQRKANALQRSLNTLRGGLRNASVLAAEIRDELAELATDAQPEQEAQHVRDHSEEDFPVHA